MPRNFLTQGRTGPPSPAPYRLLAIHAIELYLSALLRHAGQKPSSVRGMQHNLTTRTEIAVAGGLKLRDRTKAHLFAIDGNREYLVTRYEPEMTAVSQINRLTATLEEVALKVATKMRQRPGPMPTVRSEAKQRTPARQRVLPGDEPYKLSPPPHRARLQAIDEGARNKSTSRPGWSHSSHPLVVRRTGAPSLQIQRATDGARHNGLCCVRYHSLLVLLIPIPPQKTPNQRW